MPLFRGKKNISRNIETEMEAGKPQRQSIAIAYAMAKKHKAEKEACGGMMAEGGMVSGEQSSCTEHCVQPCAIHEQGSGYDHDMVSRIMAKREKMYSEGGMVANGGEDDLDKLADGRPNEFDDLALRDDLESSYTAANSGDELGDSREDADREDIVSRIMRSRSKRDRMPRPA